MSPRVGVLALQGDVEAHARALARVGARAVPVRREKDLDDLAALVLPGGESTTISKGLERERLYEPIRAFAEAGHPVLGTCAGAILLSHAVENHPVPTLALLDVRAVRNAYGTQVDSFAATADAGCAPAFRDLRCVFIRAPRLEAPGPGVEVLVRVDGAPVLVRQRRLLAATFHPELTDDDRVHRALLELAAAPGR
ncbi:MAG: pyridoxal 5'-phosphate synthase glutaminase subunit PdxT [Deltaproteobacteria bacterium]|nr:MAG: pyridoxal 5'-phosphate synthase glutaminase subunit PdxT [Deltaproteobacteria bacterium]